MGQNEQFMVALFLKFLNIEKGYCIETDASLVGKEQFKLVIGWLIWKQSLCGLCQLVIEWSQMKL